MCPAEKSIRKSSRKDSVGGVLRMLCAALCYHCHHTRRWRGRRRSVVARPRRRRGFRRLGRRSSFAFSVRVVVVVLAVAVAISVVVGVVVAFSVRVSRRRRRCCTFLRRHLRISFLYFSFVLFSFLSSLCCILFFVLSFIFLFLIRTFVFVRILFLLFVHILFLLFVYLVGIRILHFVAVIFVYHPMHSYILYFAFRSSIFCIYCSTFVFFFRIFTSFSFRSIFRMYLL